MVIRLATFEVAVTAGRGEVILDDQIVRRSGQVDRVRRAVACRVGVRPGDHPVEDGRFGDQVKTQAGNLREAALRRRLVERRRVSLTLSDTPFSSIVFNSAPVMSTVTATFPNGTARD